MKDLQGISPCVVKLWPVEKSEQMGLIRWFLFRQSPSYSSLTVLDLQDTVLTQIKIGNL